MLRETFISAPSLLDQFQRGHTNERCQLLLDCNDSGQQSLQNAYNRVPADERLREEWAPESDVRVEIFFQRHRSLRVNAVGPALLL